MAQHARRKEKTASMVGAKKETFEQRKMEIRKKIVRHAQWEVNGFTPHLTGPTERTRLKFPAADTTGGSPGRGALRTKGGPNAPGLSGKKKGHLRGPLTFPPTFHYEKECSIQPEWIGLYSGGGEKTLHSSAEWEGGGKRKLVTLPLVRASCEGTNGKIGPRGHENIW